MAVERDLCDDDRAVARRALNPELAVEDSEPVREPDEAAAVASGAADTVVAHLDLEGAVLHPRYDAGVTRPRVLGDVGQRLGHDELGGRLDRRG